MQTLKSKDRVGVSVPNIPSQTNKLGYKIKRCNKPMSDHVGSLLCLYWIELTKRRSRNFVQIMDHLNELRQLLGSAILVSKLRLTMSRNNVHISSQICIPNTQLFQDFITTYNLLARFELSVLFYQNHNKWVFS